MSYVPGRLFDNAGLVLSKSHLVFSGHGPLVLIDKTDGTTSTVTTPVSTDWCSPATVDMDGNIYTVAMSGVYSFDPNGNLRWRSATANATGAEFREFFPPAVSPDGVLYAVCADGLLRAMQTSNGLEVWHRPVDVRMGPSKVLGGAGNGLFVLWGINGVHVFDTGSGNELGLLRDGKNAEFYASRQTWALGWDFGIQVGSIYSFDTCGRMKWSTWRDAQYVDVSGIIGMNEKLSATKFDLDANGGRLSEDQMYLYSPDGTPVMGPAGARGEPYLAGADGTIYTVNCGYASPKSNQLIAYAPDLREVWHLDLGETDHCPVGNAVLDDDGILYLARAQLPTGVEVLAVQTQSPGLAESSWPNLRRDNRGSMWLTALPPISH